MQQDVAPSLETFLALKKQVEKYQREADRAEGAYEQLSKRLREEFSCTSLEEAKTLLEKLEKEEQKETREFSIGVSNLAESMKGLEGFFQDLFGTEI